MDQGLCQILIMLVCGLEAMPNTDDACMWIGGCVIVIVSHSGA